MEKFTTSVDTLGRQQPARAGQPWETGGGQPPPVDVARARGATGFGVVTSNAKVMSRARGLFLSQTVALAMMG